MKKLITLILLLVAGLCQAGVLLTLKSQGNNNPDGWAMAGTTYVSKNYNTEGTTTASCPGTADICVDNCVAASWGSTYGYNSTGAWRVSPNSATHCEDNGGWIILARPSVDETDILVFSYMLYVTDAIMDRICANGSFWDHGNKIIDLKQWNSAGSAMDDPSRVINTFQYLSGKVHATDTPDDRVVFTQESSGSSVDFSNDGVTPAAPKDWCALGDTWVWISHVFSIGDKVSSYFKFPTDSGVTRMLQRTWTQQDRLGNTYEDDEVNPSRGWFGTWGSSTVWGYWDDIDVIDTASYVVLDDIEVADGWINPPF